MNDLFGETEKLESPKKVLHKKIILHKREKLPFEREINILLTSTKNRMFISSSLHLEVKLLSGLLEKMSEDYPESFQKILDQAKVLLEEMPNYYVSQALLGSEDTILFLPTKKKLIKKEK